MNKILEKCGAAWIAHSEKTDKFLKGSIKLDGAEYKIMIMKNKFKEEEKHPDYNILLQVPDNAGADKDTDFDL